MPQPTEITTDGAVVAPNAPAAPSAPFGSVFGPAMAVAHFDGASWSAPEVVALDSFALHPGTHALHYGSSCFEGLKAHRYPDGRVVTFRADAHVARLQQSTARLCLPVPSAALVAELIALTVDANEAVAPASPGSLYLRPTVLGTDVTIGAAAHPSETAILYVLACPVGDYLPPRPLTVAVETVTPRTTPQFGVVKSGANYAMALTPIMAARERYGADQVLFAPGGQLQETGASNIVLIDGERLLTPALTEAYLHGVTRDSLLRLARHRGWTVEEREVSLDECVAWIARPHAELALSGTAAVVAPVGTLVVDGEPLPVGARGEWPRTAELRAALIDIQVGRSSFDW
ncbi:MAG: branched-chain-amino-acid transaminase [Ilumatobacteraceae bacterium]